VEVEKLDAAREILAKAMFLESSSAYRTII
jgi:hypothetical protein